MHLTIEDLEQMTDIILTPAQVAPIIKTDPNTLRWQAKYDASSLGFPVIVMKTRVKIPRIPFLQFIKGTSGASSITQPNNVKDEKQK